jgi:hypothetical protein
MEIVDAFLATTAPRPAIEKLQKCDDDNGVYPALQLLSGGDASSLICPGAPTKRKKSGGSGSRVVKWCPSLQTITEVVEEEQEDEFPLPDDDHLPPPDKALNDDDHVPEEDPPEVPPAPRQRRDDGIFGSAFLKGRRRSKRLQQLMGSYVDRSTGLRRSARHLIIR